MVSDFHTGTFNVNDWNRIDTAPKDGRSILTYPHYIVTHWTRECLSWNGTGWAGSWDEYAEGYSEVKPTHWMPLPPPPLEADHAS